MVGDRHLEPPDRGAPDRQFAGRDRRSEDPGLSPDVGGTAAADSLAARLAEGLSALAGGPRLSRRLRQALASFELRQQRLGPAERDGGVGDAGGTVRLHPTFLPAPLRRRADRQRRYDFRGAGNPGPCAGDHDADLLWPSFPRRGKRQPSPAYDRADRRRELAAMTALLDRIERLRGLGADRIGVAEAVDLWAELAATVGLNGRAPVSPVTMVRYRSLADRHLRPALGTATLAEVDTRFVARLRSELLGRTTRVMARRALHCFHGCLEECHA